MYIEKYGRNWYFSEETCEEVIFIKNEIAPKMDSDQWEKIILDNREQQNYDLYYGLIRNIQDEEKPCLIEAITDKNYLSVIMPMRI